jgi:adenine-specific DNA-methyltransferase
MTEQREAYTKRQKQAGAYYTPNTIVSSLLSWAVRSPRDRLLDPSCGDGRFLAGHRNSVGIERDAQTAAVAIRRAPWALVHNGDFFAWAANTADRFDCAVGNPPFIRYQTFNGEARRQALEFCESKGAEFSGLASSWAPFLVATASVLKPGGRMAFVVPAEVGHAPYSVPLLEYLARHFERVQIIAIRERLFEELSEDCWLLHTDGFGGSASHIDLTILENFAPTPVPPRTSKRISASEWRTAWNRRLRPYLISDSARELYQLAANHSGSRRFADFASIGIGYVSGANDFFHLRPSEGRSWRVPEHLLHPTVRNTRALPTEAVTSGTVEQWKSADEPVLLLRLPKTRNLPPQVERYLDSEAGQEARKAYKCSVRDPWYSVPDVRVPDFFLSYMSGVSPSLVRNGAMCTCTNSVHTVRMHDRSAAARLLKAWKMPFVQLSCELEGHALGGGMLKLEPREAGRVLLPAASLEAELEPTAIAEALHTLRAWRHYL